MPVLSVSQAKMKQLPPGQTTGAVYLVLTNRGDHPKTINYVTSPAADHIEIHRHFHENGLMKMRPVSHVAVEAKSALRFEPGGYHLMVFGLMKEYAVGEVFDVTFEFEGGEKVTADVQVYPQS